MQIYRLGKGWRIATYVIAPLFIIGFVYLLITSLLKPSLVNYLLMVPVSLAMISLFVYGTLDAWKGRFVIAHDRVILKSPGRLKMLMLTEIKGFRTDKNYIKIIPMRKDLKKISVSNYLSRSGEIIDWLGENYPNLDQVEGEEEERAILQNPEFGITEDARQRRLSEARKVAMIMNGGGVAVLLWVLFFPSPYELAISVGVLYPFIVIMISTSYRGMMKGDEHQNSKVPSIAMGFILPVIAFGLRMLKDFVILRYNNNLWMVISAGGILIAFFYLLPVGGLRIRSANSAVIAASILLFSSLFSYAGYVAANCILDNSEPQYFNTPVVDKTFSRGRSYSYYLILSPWDTLQKPERVQVSLGDYRETEIGDTVTVIQRPGYLRSSWVQVVVE